MNNTALYTTRGKSYEFSRPGYPPELMDYLYNSLRFADAEAIADIGSGTGKFTRLLLERGSRVFAVEPNEEMRAIAESKLSSYPGFHSVNGTASNICIKEKVDSITVAQAFHWFERLSFKEECRRILKTEGIICLIWNLRVPDSEITCACRDIFKRYCPRFVDFNIGFKEDDPEIFEFFDGECEKAVFDNPLKYNSDQFTERYLSSSYSLREGEYGYEECIKAVRDVFYRFSKDGTVVVPNKAICYSGNIR